MDDGVKFEKSKGKGKKYLTILPDGQHVDFGALGYEHYEDRTPLKLYAPGPQGPTATEEIPSAT